MLTTVMLVAIPAGPEAKASPATLREISERLCADQCEPQEYRCFDCHLSWEAGPKL